MLFINRIAKPFSYLLSALVVALLLLLSGEAYSQHRYANLSQFHKTQYELYGKKDSLWHDAVWPKFSNQIEANEYQEAGNNASWLRRKLFYESFINLKTGILSVKIDPVVNMSLGYDARSVAGDTLSQQTQTIGRGISVRGKIAEKVSFYAIFEGTQMRLPLYIENYTDQYRAMPSIGYYKNYNLGYNRLRDVFYNEGAFSWSATEWLDVSFGQGKHFIGSGYRSMFLSDNAAVYPYLKLESSFGKIKYVNLYTQMNTVPHLGVDLYPIKWNIMHFLSINISPRLNINLFESVVWAESNNNNTRLPLALLNPIIFYRPVEAALGTTSGNALIGLGATWKAFGQSRVYGQFVLDEFRINSLLGNDGKDYLNKVGLQIGIKGTVEASKHSVFYRAELNMARPYTYSHTTLERNYGHFNQPIAHTLGGNFYEGILQLRLQKGRFYANLQGIYAHQGIDDNNENWGSNILKSYETRERDSGNYVGQGNTLNRINISANIGYILNPESDLSVELAGTYRTIDNQFSPRVFNSGNVSLSLRSQLYTQYTDF